MSSEPNPVLSVAIPVWNGERYLAEAITSVLEQRDAPDLEIIVIDDGSDDESALVAEQFGPPVRCLRLPHAGLAAARNAGAASARGEYLLHLDSDDVLPADSITSRMAVFNTSPEADLVVGQMLSFISPELDPEAASRYRVPSGPQRGGLPGASLVRTCFASRVGSFDTDRNNSPDLDWMARAMEYDPHIVELPGVVLHRRIHGNNLSLRGSPLAGDRLAILRAALNRRREAAGG